MDTLVIYDSAYGNTEKVAQAVGNGLAAQGQVEVRQVDAVKPDQLAGLKLLIVGSPTQRFNMTPATKELLEAIPSHGLKGVRVAAFDTRYPMSKIEETPVLAFFVRLAGRSAFAANHIAKQLKKKGGEPVAKPEGFFVSGTEGPLLADELERAAGWAAQLAS